MKRSLGDSSNLFRGSRGNINYFSAYAPGISGIANAEQKYSTRVVKKACSFGDANTFLRNAILLLDGQEKIQLGRWLSELLGDIELQVLHNDVNDLEIHATAVFAGQPPIPFELLGTGYLQLIQIFCYLLLFKPSILLIDEPDIHLHPSVQEKLGALLPKVAHESSTKIILATHSPFIVRGAPITTKVYWLNDGQIVNEERNAIELALGWGAFGKKVLIHSEDANITLLKKIVSQWPEIERQVTILPGRGHRSLLKPDQAKELKDTFNGTYELVIHRDRDALTQREVDQLISKYQEDNIFL